MSAPGGTPRERALVARRPPRSAESASLVKRILPPALRRLQDDLEARLARIPTTVNEFGVDPFGYEPGFAAQTLLPLALVYRSWLRVETHGIERVPSGRVLLIANHGGNTFAWDGAMLALAMLLDAEPPRVVRGMAEYYLPTLPFFGNLMHRMGSVVGTPSNCAQLLDRGEAIAVFPEGERGFVKPYSQRYQLQRFGLGFMRLALETDTPIVPVGIVGSEEQSPGLLRSRWLGKLVGAPVAPITLTFPWLGLASFLPLPVKFRLHFGAPLRFDGDPDDEDAEIQKKVDVVKDAIRAGIAEGLAARRGWFA
jgi:1-acyl-sn-glycerol-3-phosphate acyltransferase